MEPKLSFRSQDVIELVSERMSPRLKYEYPTNNCVHGICLFFYNFFTYIKVESEFAVHNNSYIFFFFDEFYFFSH